MPAEDEFRGSAPSDPAVLKGLTQAQIADALTDPASPVAKAVPGAANVLTAAICEATGDQPANSKGAPK